MVVGGYEGIKHGEEVVVAMVVMGVALERSMVSMVGGAGVVVGRQ